MKSVLLEADLAHQLAGLRSYVRSYKLDLPRTADYFQWDPQFTPHEYGPCSRRVGSFDAQLSSRDWCIVGDVVTDDYVLLGALTAMRSFTYFTVFKEQGRFTSVVVQQPEITDEMLPEEVAILRGSDWRELLRHYASMVAEKMSARVGDTSTNSAGYCSWDHYYHHVTEQQLIRNLGALAASAFPASYVQIDDGYQLCHGDWLDRHSNWPTQLSETAKRINDAGFGAGIWTMPFLASTSSNVYNDHPDWFVQDDTGASVVVEGWSPEPHNVWACLDTTNPRVQQHLRFVFESFYEMGFRYFKLDGIGFCAPRGQRYNDRVTGVGAFRLGLQILRESVRDSIILGCGAIMPCIGLVDHCRVSPDTGIKWRSWGLPTCDCEMPVDMSEPVSPCMPSLENALKTSLSHWWMYDTYFRADPDVVMARQNNSELTFGETRMSALMAILTGVAFTSDKVDEISKDRLRLLNLACRTRMRDVLPMDWKMHAWPHVYRGLVDGRSALAIFNFSDTTALYDVSDYEGASAFNELLHPLGIVRNVLELPSHDAALLVASQ